MILLSKLYGNLHGGYSTQINALRNQHNSVRKVPYLLSITTPLFPLFNKKQTMTISNGGSRGVSEGGYLNISCSIIDRYCSWGTRNGMRVLQM